MYRYLSILCYQLMVYIMHDINETLTIYLLLTIKLNSYKSETKYDYSISRIPNRYM